MSTDASATPQPETKACGHRGPCECAHYIDPTRRALSPPPDVERLFLVIDQPDHDWSGGSTTGGRARHEDAFTRCAVYWRWLYRYRRRRHEEPTPEQKRAVIERIDRKQVRRVGYIHAGE